MEVLVRETIIIIIIIIIITSIILILNLFLNFYFAPIPNFFSTTFFVSQIEQEPDCHQCIDLKSDTKKIKAISNYFSSENNSKTLGTKSQERTGNQKLIARELVRTCVTDDIKIQDDWAIVDDKNLMKKETSYIEDRYHGNESKSYGIETDALFFNENNEKSYESTKKRKLEAEEEKISEKIDIKNNSFVSTKRENTYKTRENNVTEDRDKEKDLNSGNDDENKNMDLSSAEIIEDLLCPICSFKLNNFQTSPKKIWNGAEKDNDKLNYEYVDFYYIHYLPREGG